MRLERPVLVATDLGPEADEALRQGQHLAQAAGVPLLACHVLPELLGMDPLFPQQRIKDALALPQVSRRAADAVAERARQALEPDAAPEIVIATGSPHAGILTEADRIGAGLVVLGARGAAGGDKPLVGVAERVVRHAPCPVLIARPSPRGAVLGATDFSDPALPAVEAAVAEAARRAAPVVIVHCMDLLPPLGVVGYEVPPLGPEVLTAMRAHWEQRLRESLERFGATGSFVLKEGPAGALIPQLAAELPAELVVVGTHGRTGLRRLVLGSVAEAVVRAAPCSVLVVRLASR